LVLIFDSQVKLESQRFYFPTGSEITDSRYFSKATLNGFIASEFLRLEVRLRQQTDRLLVLNTDFLRGEL
jgi:hypothetical protein